MKQTQKTIAIINTVNAVKHRGEWVYSIGIELKNNCSIEKIVVRELGDYANNIFTSKLIDCIKVKNSKLENKSRNRVKGMRRKSSISSSSAQAVLKAYEHLIELAILIEKQLYLNAKIIGS